MLLSKQPGDTGIYATATPHEVRLYYILDRVLPFVSGGAAAAEAAGVLGGGRKGATSMDAAEATQRIAAAPQCVPRDHLRMLYRLTATGTGASRSAGLMRNAAMSTAAPTLSPRLGHPIDGSNRKPPSYYGSSSALRTGEVSEQRVQEEAATAHRWGSPLIPFHTVHCSATAVGGSDAALPLIARGHFPRSSQEWATPTAAGNVEDSGGGLLGSAAPFTGFSAAANGGICSAVCGTPSTTRHARSINSARGACSASATPTTLSLSCATDCLLFLVANNEGHSWIGRSDATTLSPLRVSTSLQVRRHGGAMAGASGGRHYAGLAGGGGGTVASSSPRPPRPYSATFGVPVNTSFPTHSFASSERVATPPNTIADDSVPNAAALMDYDCEEEEEDDGADDGDDDATHLRGGRGTRRRSSSAGVARPSSFTDGVEAFSGGPSTVVTTLPTGRAFSRHDRVITASGWDPRNSAILALGRQGGIVQLLDVEYMIGSAASTRCSSTTSSAASDDTAEPFASSATGAARTTTSGGGGGNGSGPSLTPYCGADHLSYSVLQQREMVGPVTALDWMPQSHLTVVAARRRDALGCYAELLDLRASHDGVTYLGAPPEVFAVPVYARGVESAAPSVLCSAEHVACHPSQRYVATVGTARMRDIVQLWDIRMASRPVAYQVYARAGYTSLCWSATEAGVVLGTTRDGGLRAHSFKELSNGSNTATTGSSAAVLGGSSGRPNANTGDSIGPTAFGGASQRSRRRRGTSSGAAPLQSHSFAGSGGEQEVHERWGAGSSSGHIGTSNHHANGNTHNNSGYSGTEAEAEDEMLDDSGSFRSGASFDGAGTALSSITEGSNALVHVNVKAQSALKCRLPSRVPAAAVAWVCRPTAERIAAATAVDVERTGDVERNRGGEMGRAPQSPPLHPRGDGTRATRHAGTDSEDNRNGVEDRRGTAERVTGVMERGCRTDLPQLLLLNSKNGELYTQVYNPRGSIVTILNQSMGLVGAGPNGFIARPSATYKAATYAYEEMLMIQLERQSRMAAAASKHANDLPLASVTPAATSGRGNGVPTQTASSARGGLNGTGGVGDGGGSLTSTSAAPGAASARRVSDRPVDLMGLGLLDEEDEEEEEDVHTESGGDGYDGGGTGVANIAREQHTEGQVSALSHNSESGDAASGEDNGEEPTSPGRHERGQVLAPPSAGPSTETIQARLATTVGRGEHSSLKESGGDARGQPSAGEGHVQLQGSDVTGTRRSAVRPSQLPSAPSPVVYPIPEGRAAVDATMKAHAPVPAELGYCQFHRVDRTRLIWRRLRAGFSCDPIRNLRVLLSEGIDREAYTAFLYGCCASMLLYPSSTAKAALSHANEGSSGTASLPLVLGARRVVPGLLELLVSERQLRAQLGLRDTRLSSSFRLRRHRAAAALHPSVPAVEACVGGAASTTGSTATPPASTPSAAVSAHNALGLVVPPLPGLPSAMERGNKGPPGFFRSPFEAAAASMRSGVRPPAQSALSAGGGARGGSGAGTAGRNVATAGSTLPGGTRGGGALAPRTSGGNNNNTDASGGGSTEQPTHAAALGMLNQLILQSMGWLPPPALCHVDGQGQSKSVDHIEYIHEDGVTPRTEEAQPQNTLSTASPQHPAEKFFVQGDGLGLSSLQEALERRVAVLVLLDRLEDAAELLSLHSTRNPQYPSIALTLSAARGQNSTLLSLAASQSAGVTFWMHLLLTYLELLMSQQSRDNAMRQTAPTTPSLGEPHSEKPLHDALLPAGSSADVVVAGDIAASTTRFDALFTLPEQKAQVLHLLRGNPRLAMSDKIALATALLLPSHYHGAHVDNLIEVLQILVHQQYRSDASPSFLASCVGMGGSAAGAVSSAGAGTKLPNVSPATSPPPPGTVGPQRCLNGRRAPSTAATSSPPLMPTPQPPSASSTLTQPAAPRQHACGDAQDVYHLTDVLASGAFNGDDVGKFVPICGCSLLLVSAVEGVSTDCRALQRYIDESGDTQTTLCYVAVFGNATSSTFHLWRESYRHQLNEQGLSMWRSQLDLLCVKLLRSREEAERDLTSDRRAEGGSGGVGGPAGIGYNAKDSLTGGLNCGNGAGGGVACAMSGLSGADASVVGVGTAGGSVALLNVGMTMPKGFPSTLGALGTDVGVAPPSSAAAMMSTQTAMMMKRTLKGFAQTTATSTTERDRSMREAAAGAVGLNAPGDLHRTVELRCNCGQAMHATAPGKSSMSAMVSSNISRKQLIPCGNPECRQWQTPMCTVCGERMEHRATELPPERFFAWCSVCLHGGHWCHLREWFSKHAKCPVENCSCHCCDSAHSI